MSDVVLGSFPNIKQEPEHENAHLLTTIEHIPVEGLPTDYFMATKTQQPYAATEADDAVGSDDDNWNETPVRKRHCTILDGENDAMRYIMRKADMKAVERITDLAKQMKDSLPPEQLVPADYQNSGVGKDSLPPEQLVPADYQNSGVGSMHSMRAEAYHHLDLRENQTEALARTLPSVQSSVPCSSPASYKSQPSLGAFPRQVVQVLQEYYDHGTHYPSQILKLRLAIKTVRHTLASFLILD